MFSKKTFLTILSCLIFISLPTLARASLFRFVLPERKLYAGDTFLIRIVADAGEKAFNVTRADVNIPQGILEVKGVYKSDSVLRYWPDEPSYSKELNMASFAGGLPTPGFAGKDGLVGLIKAKAVKEGAVQLSFRKTSLALLDDGFGTKDELELKDANISINKAPKGYVPYDVDLLSAKDNIPPENFTPVIAKSPWLYGGKYFAVFETADSGSGIDHYEIAEQKISGSITNNESKLEWRKAKSPAVLINQSGRVKVYVKAFDKAGNLTIGTTEENLGIPQTWWIILAVLIVLLSIFVYWACRRYRKHKNLESRIQNQGLGN